MRISGRDGFDETGEWDYAAGSVKGYREWHLPYVQAHRFTPNHVPMGTGLVPRYYLLGHWSKHWDNAEWQVGKCEVSSDHNDTLPVEKCGCGFWAYWYTGDWTTPVFYSPFDWKRDRPTSDVFRLNVTIRGVAEGAGRVLMGEKGFRCQKMRIIALAITPKAYQECNLGQFFDISNDMAIGNVYTTVRKILPNVPLLDDPDKLKEYM